MAWVRAADGLACPGLAAAVGLGLAVALAVVAAAALGLAAAGLGLGLAAAGLGLGLAAAGLGLGLAAAGLGLAAAWAASVRLRVAARSGLAAGVADAGPVAPPGAPGVARLPLRRCGRVLGRDPITPG